MGYISNFNIYAWCKRLQNVFGTKFFLLISSCYIFVKGANYDFATQGLLPYTVYAGLPSQEYQLNASVAIIPFSFKGFYAVASDSFPLFGYSKKWYMIFAAILGTSSACALCLVPYSAIQSFNLLPAMLLFCIHLQTALSDILCEGKYVEKMKEHPHTKGDIVTYVWFAQSIGSFIPSLTIGPIGDQFDPRYIWIFCIPFCGQILPVLISNCMIDDQVPAHQANKLDMVKIKEQWKLMLMAIAIGIGGIGTLTFSLFGNRLSQFIYAILSSIFLCILGIFLLPPLIGKANLYIYLSFFLYINITGPVDYFYLAEPDCVPGGPNFDYTFYRTYSSLLTQFFKLLGIYLYHKLISKMKFPKQFWVTTIMRVVSSLFDVVLVNRWNKSIGIDDEYLYLFGNSIVYQVSYMMDFLPSTLLMSKISPLKVESTVYAILAGISAFGMSLNGLVGIYISDLLGIDSLPESGDGTPCNFDNLTYLILICHCFAPLIAIPFTFILIPNKYIKDDILEEHVAEKMRAQQLREQMSAKQII